jgi:N-methylhydantoinase A/oxoprolinase/acetone carboxylase beta subunit
VRLDLEAARAAVGRLAGELGLDVLAAAAGIVRVADEEMLRALRVATVQRGVDPRGYALVAFGGAGPMHAARLAEQLGVPRVLCPPAAGLLSALGLASADRRRDMGRSLLLEEGEIAQGRSTAMRELAGAARAGLSDARLETHYDLRYRGQSFELQVTAAPDAAVPELRELFERAHEDRYGYRDPEGRIELVNVRVSAIEERTHSALPSRPTGKLERSERRAVFDGSRLETTVLRGAAVPGERCAGPAVWELPEATAVVPPGWVGAVDEHGTLVLEQA